MKKEENKRKMSLRRIGKANYYPSDELKAKRSEFLKNNPLMTIKKGQTYEEVFGKEKAKEIKLKQSLALLGKPKSEKHKLNVKIARRKQITPVKDSSIEVKIQNYLKQLGIDFLTHQYIKDIKHGYQCDILIPSMNLVIECGGNYWHSYPTGREIDHVRTSELLEKGFKVLRLWEFEIKEMGINDFERRLDAT